MLFSSQDHMNATAAAKRRRLHETSSSSSSIDHQLQLRHEQPPVRYFERRAAMDSKRPTVQPSRGYGSFGQHDRNARPRESDMTGHNSFGGITGMASSGNHQRLPALHALPRFPQEAGAQKRAPHHMDHHQQQQSPSHVSPLVLPLVASLQQRWKAENTTTPMAMTSRGLHSNQEYESRSLQLHHQQPPLARRPTSQPDVRHSHATTPGQGYESPPLGRITLPQSRYDWPKRGVLPHTVSPSHTDASTEDDPQSPTDVAITSVAAVSTPVAHSSTNQGSGLTPSPIVKHSRYLREMDRRTILLRIERGETQAALAKEYQVSRAAICNLYKHREEVMSRKNQNPLAKHPKKPRQKTFKVKVNRPRVAALGSTSSLPNGIYELPPPTVSRLLSTMQSQGTTDLQFQRCSDRVLRLLMEEALTRVATRPTEVFLTDDAKTSGVALELPICAISMAPEGCPLLDVFHSLEPEQAIGYARMGMASSTVNDDDNNKAAALTSSAQCQEIVVRNMIQAPGSDSSSQGASLEKHHLLLLDVTTASGDALCSVLQRMQTRGAQPSRITVVTLVAPLDDFAIVRRRFPNVHVVTLQTLPLDAPAGDLLAMAIVRNRLAHLHRSVAC